MNAFRKNPALFIGLAIPLLMILIFGGIPFISSFVVPPPEYNFIYSLNNYGPEGKLKVVDGKLVLQVYNSVSPPREPQQTLYLVDVHSKKSTKLDFLSPWQDNLVPPGQTRDFVLQGISLKALDTSNISPDGYQIVTGNNDSFFSLVFFFGDNRRNAISLKKSGRVDNFSIPPLGYGGKFEGWVIP